MPIETQQLMQKGMELLGVAVVALVGLVVYLSAKHGLQQMLRREHITQPVYAMGKGLIRWLVVIIVIVVALQQIGVQISHIFTGLLTIAGMVAIGFIAVWSILSNMMCSLLLIVFNTFKIGDEIEVVEPVGGSGLRGKVVSFNVMFTTLDEKVAEGEAPALTQIPNNIFFQKSLRRRPGQETEGLGQYLLSKPLPLPLAKKKDDPASRQ